MKSRTCYPLVGVLSLAAAAWSQAAQSSAEGPAQTPVEITPVTATSGMQVRSEKPASTQRTEPQSLEATVLTAGLDDSIPLPIPAVVKAGPDGDVQIAPASGDPFFLSFIAGPYSPPEGELVDPALLLFDGNWGDARPGNETYAMVMFQKRITDERLQTLKELDCRILGFHPHYTTRVAIPVDRLLEVSTLDFVRWVGAPRTWQKIHPAMRDEVKGRDQTAPLDLYVSVFESDMNENSVQERFGSVWGVTPENSAGFAYEGDQDVRLMRHHSNGWMHHKLQSMGLQVNEYRPDIDTFVVTGTVASVGALSKLDFVQFVEPVPVAKLNASPVHDESIPMIMADETRAAYDGSTNSIAQVGIVDSGIEADHNDLNLYGWGWNCSTGTNAWNDTAASGTGHGTHVAGTILGTGTVQADHTGVAPGLASWSLSQALFNIRRFPGPCSLSLSAIVTQMVTAVGTGTVPHVVNNSWGSSFGGAQVPTGTEADARTVDTHVFNTGQVWVWSAGDYSTQNVNIEASAKNALTVGSSLDYNDSSQGNPGEMVNNSGGGPVADGRWKPTVNAPGRFISSLAANDNNGYVGKSGTSMAAPHVTGLIAQLIDHHSFLRDREPAEIAALLMATAQTHDNAVLNSPNAVHLDTFGAGRINAYRSHWNTQDWGSTTWSPNLAASNWTFGDFTVPVGATRLVVVMNYIEEAGAAGAGTALVNDFDMYLDRAPIDPAGNTGEYFAQQSGLDNTEIRIVNNPNAGAWRWKVWPGSATSNVKLGVTILWVKGDMSPTNTVTVTASDSYIRPGNIIDVDINVAADDYFSASTLVDINGNSRTIHSKTSVLQDGIVSDLSGSANSNDYITLGDIRQGQSKNAAYRISFATEGNKNITIQTTSETAQTANPTVQVIVDATTPGVATNLVSSSHTAGQWSNDPTIEWQWTAATDDRSGIAGYAVHQGGTGTVPGFVQDIGPVTQYVGSPIATSNSAKVFALRAVDRSGNWSPNIGVSGVYLIDTLRPARPGFDTSNFPQGGSSCSGTISVDWLAAIDANSGVNGYSYLLNQNAAGTPDQTVDTAGTTFTASRAPGTYYLHVISKDRAGNWSNSTAHFGPFTLTVDCGTDYCAPALPNSTGGSSSLTISGSDIVSDNDLTLNAANMPTGNFGYFLASTAQGPPIIPPGSQGRYCLGGALGRFNRGGEVRFTGATGAFSLDVDLTSIPVNPVQSVVAGQSWSFQAWHRDQNPFNTSNFTNVVTVLFK